MAKRVNPINFRLGFWQTWNINATFYGKKFRSYIKVLHSKNKLNEYFLNFFNLAQALGEATDYKIHKNYWDVTIQLYDYKLKRKVYKLNSTLQQLCATSYYWVNPPLFLNLYNQKSQTNSALLLYQWIKFYFLKNKTSLKNTINVVESDLLTILGKNKVNSNKYGLKLTKLRGLKICCKGRLGNLRNPLTQIFKRVWGSVPLPKLNSYVDYYQGSILTKRGTYGLQIWMFYSN
uniref:Ribosomal protein S4 n=1 Tax=Hildenbrandia rubra TaxID=31481 RepID=A0A0A7A6S0_9FLOR|nr:ribosomal protein S4 [Hildenbrandia rubra]AHB62125.1 ribosomal protein S4 [Hildenbrandia rubra]